MKAVVQCDEGRWAAACPVPGCGGAEHCGVKDGHLGLLTGRGFRCNRCGWQGAADWPPGVDDIAALLAARPVPFRNWRPGETLHDLLAENIEHGILPAVGPQILVDAHHILSGRELLPAGRTAIGGH